MCVWLCTSLLLQCGIGWSQGTEDETEEPAPATNPALQALNDELALAKARAEIAEQKQKQAEAERDAEKAGLPASETKGLDGKVTVGEGAGYFAEILAYKSLEQAADQITLEMNKHCESGLPVVLTDQFDLGQTASLWTLITTKLDRIDDVFKRLNKDYEDNGKTRNESPLTLLPTLLGAAADVASFFKVNREIYARTFTINNKALTALVARRLTFAGCRVKVPDLDISANGVLYAKFQNLALERQKLGEKYKEVEETFKQPVAQLAELIAAITKLEAERKRLKQADGNESEIAKLDTQIAAAKQEIAVKNLEENAEAWQRAKTEFDAAFKAADATFETLSSPPEKGQKSPLEVVALIDTIKSVCGAHVLYLSIASQGGEVEVTTSIWTGGRVSYIGGSVTVFYVTDLDGGLKAAGTLPQFARGIYGTRGGVKGLTELDKADKAPVTTAPPTTPPPPSTCNSSPPPAAPERAPDAATANPSAAPVNRTQP